MKINIYQKGSNDVLVHLDCYNEIPQICHPIKNRNLFLTVSRAWKSEVKLPGWLNDGPLPVLRLVVVSAHGKAAKELCGVLLIKALIPLMRAAPSWPKYLPKAPPSNAFILEIKIVAYEFWGETNIQTIGSNYLIRF